MTMISLRRAVLIAGISTLAVLASAKLTEAASINFVDTFEAATLDPFWTLTQQNGNIQLSTAQSQSGSQSVQLTGTGGGQVNVWLSHVLPMEMTGTISVGFYDTTPGIYAGLYVLSSDPLMGFGYAVNVADWNSSTYVWHSPTMSETATSVARTPGWHNLELEITPTSYIARVDSIVVGSLSGAFTFNEIRLLVSGPGEVGTFYFDNFNVNATSEPTAVPEPGTLILLAVGAGMGAVRGRVRRAARAAK